MSQRPPQRDAFAGLAVLVGLGFFVASGVQLASSWYATSSESRSEKAGKQHKALEKPWHHSNVQVTYQTDSTMCDYPFSSASAVAKGGSSSPRPVIRAGALLKLIDIVAGVAARRHAGGSCVTISLDSVLFLSPIHLGDLIHLSAAVNRSFTSSMEVGVRVMKEDPMDSGKTFYVSHAYLTFVLKKDPRSPQMPTLVPQTPLQWRRHFLAGQRRAKRLNAAQKGQDEDGVQTAVKDDVRTSVMDLSAPKDIDAKIDERGSVAGSKAIETIEVELLAQALYGRRDQGVAANITSDEYVEAYLLGDEDGQKIRHPLSRVQQAAKEVGLEGDGEKSTVQRKVTKARRMSSLPLPHLVDPKTSSLNEIRAQDTCVQTLHIVFPEHANSVEILFGGQTMSWMEEAALMSARHLHEQQEQQAGPRCSWRTVAMDGLEFRRPVKIGEVMTFTAICLHTFNTSAEIYVVASAETHFRPQGGNGGETYQRRFTNDALFTLALIPDDGQRQSGSGGGAIAVPSLRKVVTDRESALRVLADKAGKRKVRRIELRDMLTRIYASN